RNPAVREHAVVSNPGDDAPRKSGSAERVVVPGPGCAEVEDRAGTPRHVTRPGIEDRELEVVLLGEAEGTALHELAASRNDRQLGGRVKLAGRIVDLASEVEWIDLQDPGCHLAQGEPTRQTLAESANQLVAQRDILEVGDYQQAIHRDPTRRVDLRVEAGLADRAAQG